MRCCFSHYVTLVWRRSWTVYRGKKDWLQAWNYDLNLFESKLFYVSDMGKRKSNSKGATCRPKTRKLVVKKTTKKSASKPRKKQAKIKETVRQTVTTTYTVVRWCKNTIFIHRIIRNQAYCSKKNVTRMSKLKLHQYWLNKRGRLFCL